MSVTRNDALDQAVLAVQNATRAAEDNKPYPAQCWAEVSRAWSAIADQMFADEPVLPIRQPDRRDNPGGDKTDEKYFRLSPEEWDTICALREGRAVVMPRTGGVVDRPVANEGLSEKFHVRRVDGRDSPGGDKADAKYFVLDYVHDPYARFAVAAYANKCESMCPELASDLRAALDRTSTPRFGGGGSGVGS